MPKESEVQHGHYSNVRPLLIDELQDDQHWVIRLDKRNPHHPAGLKPLSSVSKVHIHQQMAKDYQVVGLCLHQILLLVLTVIFFFQLHKIHLLTSQTVLANNLHCSSCALHWSCIVRSMQPFSLAFCSLRNVCSTSLCLNLDYCIPLTIRLFSSSLVLSLSHQI
uniref:Uncharacterized protein n=1 Tax=Cacopsylla melanoneura TaxID=428564 RepID=A0A8D8V7V2_9HEMI